jgi:lysozyme
MKRQKLTLTLMLVAFLSFSCVEEQAPEDDCTRSDDQTINSITSSDDSIGGEKKCDDGGNADDDDAGNNDDDDGGSTGGTPGDGQTTDAAALNAPWERDNSSIVIDAYEHNRIDWDKMAADQKMVGVIHRSSIGTRVDAKYVSRKKIAKDRGYLWGAYHLGRRGNTIAQAKLFLELINGEEDTLMILDLEDTGSSRFMSLDEAEVFMDYVYEQTGRIPVVYANHSTTKKLNSKYKSNALFQQAKLWYARFKSRVTDYPAGIWTNYFLWQFSSEINCSRTGSCLYNVPGTSSDMDINVFNGNQTELRMQWNNY